MPTRMLRDGILRSERVDQLSMGAELFFRRLMSVVDDYGRYYANPKLLKVDCFPLKEVTGDDVVGWLAECRLAGLVAVYEVAAKGYLEIADFGQRVRSDSKFPPAPSNVREFPTSAKQETAVCPPLRAPASGVGVVVVAEGESGGEGAPPPLALDEGDSEELDPIAAVLQAAMGSGVGPPDDEICGRVLEAMQGGTVAELEAVLVDFRRRRAAPEKYAFWVGVVRQAMAPRVRARWKRAVNRPVARPVKACQVCGGHAFVLRSDGAGLNCPGCFSGPPTVVFQPGEMEQLAARLRPAPEFAAEGA